MVERKIACPSCGTEDYPSNIVCWQCGAQLKPQELPVVQEYPPVDDMPVSVAASKPNLYGEIRNRSESPVRPLAVSILVGFECLGAVFIIIGGIGLLLLTPGGSPLKGAALFISALGGGVLYMAYKLWFGANWARIGFIVLFGLAAISNLGKLLVGNPSTANAASGTPSTGNHVADFLYLLLAVCFIIVLNSRDTKQFCCS